MGRLIGALPCASMLLVSAGFAFLFLHAEAQWEVAALASVAALGLLLTGRGGVEDRVAESWQVAPRAMNLFGLALAVVVALSCAHTVAAILERHGLEVALGAAGSAVDIFRDPRLPTRIPVEGGVLAEACGRILTEFFAAKRAAISFWDITHSINGNSGLL